MANLKTAGATDAAPRWATAALVLADGAVFWGKGVGAPRHAVGEVLLGADAHDSQVGGGVGGQAPPDATARP